MRSTDLDVTLLCSTISTLLMHPFSQLWDAQILWAWYKFSKRACDYYESSIEKLASVRYSKFYCFNKHLLMFYN